MKYLFAYIYFMLFAFTATALEKTEYIYPNIETKIDDSLWLSSRLQTLNYSETYDHITLKNTTLTIYNLNYYSQHNLESEYEQTVFSTEDSTLLKEKYSYQYNGFNIVVFHYRKIELNEIIDNETNLYSFLNPIVFYDRVSLSATHIDTNFLVINKFRIDGIEENKLTLETQLKKIIDNTIFVSPKKIDFALNYPVTQKHQEDYSKNYTDYTLKRLDLLMKQLPNVTLENAIRDFADNIENYLPKSNNSIQNTDDIDPNFVASIWWEKAIKNKLKFNAYMDSLYVSLQNNWKIKFEPISNKTISDESNNTLTNLSIQEIYQYISKNLPKAVEIKLHELLNSKKNLNDDINENDNSFDSVIIPSIERTYEPQYDFNPFQNQKNTIILFQDFALPEIGFSYNNYYNIEKKIINGEFTLNEYLNNITQYEFPSISYNSTTNIDNIEKLKNNIEKYKDMTSEYDNMIIDNAIINKLNNEIFKEKYSIKYFVQLGAETKYIKEKTIVTSIWFLCSPNTSYFKDTLTDYIVLSFTKNNNQWQPSYSILKANFGNTDTRMPGVSFSENANGKDYVTISYNKIQFIADKKNHAIGGWTAINKNDSSYYKTYTVSFPNCTYSIVGCGDREETDINVFETIINSNYNPSLIKIDELISKNKSKYKPFFTSVFNELKKYDFDHSKLPATIILSITNQEKILEEIDNKLYELQRGYCANLKPTDRVYISTLYFDDLNLDGKDEVFYFSISNGKLLEYNIYTIKNNKVVKYENANALKQMQNTKSYKLLEEKSKQTIEESINLPNYDDYLRE